jgi:hypothetical protein
MSLPLSDGDERTRNPERCDSDGAACLYWLVATVRRAGTRRLDVRGAGTWSRQGQGSGRVGRRRITCAVAAPAPFGRCVHLHVAVVQDRSLTAGLWSVMLANPVLHSGGAGAGMASLAGPRPSPAAWDVLTEGSLQVLSWYDEASVSRQRSQHCRRWTPCLPSIGGVHEKQVEANFYELRMNGLQGEKTRWLYMGIFWARQFCYRPHDSQIKFRSRCQIALSPTIDSLYQILLCKCVDQLILRAQMRNFRTQVAEQTSNGICAARPHRHPLARGEGRTTRASAGFVAAAFCLLNDPNWSPDGARRPR